MIARVGICAEAILDELDAAPSDLAHIHREIVRCLLAHGEIVFSGESEQRELRSAIGRLASRSADSAKAWEAALTDGRWRFAHDESTALHKIEDIDTLRKDWRDSIALAILDEVRAEIFGCPDDALSTIDASGLEIAKCKANWETSTFRELRALADKHVVRAGTPRDEFAARYLNPVLCDVRHVAVVDRYLGSGLVKARGRTPTQPAEFEWILDLVDKHTSASDVSLFTAFDDERADEPFSGQDIRDAVDEMWERLKLTGGITRLNVLTAPVKTVVHGRAARFPHERHLRVSSGSAGASCGFTFPAGFDRLRAMQASEDWRVLYMWSPEDVSALRREEERAKRLATQRFCFAS
jgi:hypothetical protein